MADSLKKQDQQSKMTTDRTPLLPSKRQDMIEEDVYEDYHEASVPSAVFNLSTTIVGAGIMALPATMKVLGLPLGILSIIIMGFLSENSIQIMLRYSRPSGARSYGGLMGDAFGTLGRVVVQLCIIINNFGILIVYLIIIGDVLSGSTGGGEHYTGVLEEWAGGATWWNERTFVLFTVMVVILLPLVSLRHVDSLKWTSALSVALAVVFVVVIAGVTMWKLVAGEIVWPRLTPDVYDQQSFWKAFTVIPVIMTAYICHHNVHPIANELAGTADSSHETMKNVVQWSMFLCGTIYLCTATFGYLLFGEATSHDILSNFDTDLGVPYSHLICIIVRISYAVHIMLVFPLLNFSLRLNLDAILFPRATPLAHDTIRFSLVTGFLICCIFFGSAVVPNIWIAFQFTGATATVCLGFIFPAIVLLKDKPLLATKSDKKQAVVMVILAILSSVVAVTTNLFNLFEPGKPAGLNGYFLH
ncbi:amino acid transporter AVT6A [Physcomitrium patens]|uniref:Amino acid transporter transmembrane domain-containing protein n=1 Tax=Physcomitrium patens TaxID=3218 RepID=A0A2K1J1F2_PHYPA|nr:amino acid transporter AVT6A-like [Physcomitrium patens]PNR35354.1 hypothetical protein PHYPA_023254 [Physcomitrium patens]|eukprot:XP_024402654.1 amino acid transporter AVT6A-like [Physcomitrella patens]